MDVIFFSALPPRKWTYVHCFRDPSLDRALVFGYLGLIQVIADALLWASRHYLKRRAETRMRMPATRT